MMKWIKVQYYLGWSILIGCLVYVVFFNGKGELMPEERREKEWPLLIKIAKEYKLSKQDTIMLLAIREAENGPPGLEFGVMAARNTNLEEQARWAAGSIRANRERYRQLTQEGVYHGSRRNIVLKEVAVTAVPEVEGYVLVSNTIKFPEFFGYYGSPTGFGWAPIHGEMPEKDRENHKQWAKNVRSGMGKFTKRFKEKGVLVQ